MYLTTRGRSGALDLHQNGDVNWSYNLHQMAEPHPARYPRSSPNCHAIVARSLRDRGRIAVQSRAIAVAEARSLDRNHLMR